jgi:hypothetical protein
MSEVWLSKYTKVTVLVRDLEETSVNVSVTAARSFIQKAPLKWVSVRAIDAEK